MSYAADRVYLDADSHLMERPDFLRDFASADIRERLEPINGGPQDKNAVDWHAVVAGSGHPEERVAEMRALGDALIAGPKGYLALGAFNREERTHALDQLGFGQQLVFATFSNLYALQGDDLSLKYGAAAAHNRAMADFCGQDVRLLGVGILPLDEPDMAAKELDHLLSLDLKAAWVSHDHCGGRSPGHNAFDPIWARLAEANVPFVLHVGGRKLQLDEPWMNTGRPVPNDWLGGGENVRGKDMLGLHQHAELFLGAMIFDGVFERHRKLRGAAVELGAGWVPSWLKRLDWSAKIWKKEADLAALTRTPTETAIEHLGFTPFVYEDVGDLIVQSDDSLYLFSSDYPHFEGSRNPIERFEQFLCAASVSEDAKSKFYEENFRRVIG
ncbi:MAG: amidohydrolase family protein [Pseudomonadota bacterium]